MKRVEDPGRFASRIVGCSCDAVRGGIILRMMRDNVGLNALAKLHAGLVWRDDLLNREKRVEDPAKKWVEAPNISRICGTI